MTVQETPIATGAPSPVRSHLTIVEEREVMSAPTGLSSAPTTLQSATGPHVFTPGQTEPPQGQNGAQEPARCPCRFACLSSLWTTLTNLAVGIRDFICNLCCCFRSTRSSDAVQLTPDGTGPVPQVSTSTAGSTTDGLSLSNQLILRCKICSLIEPRPLPADMR